MRAELLDCIQSNLAVLADRFHGPDTHLALGASLRFSPAPWVGGLPSVEPPAAEQIAEAMEWLGMIRQNSWRNVSGEMLGELARRHGVLYVLADSFEMPWLPYFGRRHMGHSFLVEAGDSHAVVIDAYFNHTPWGKAAPGRWNLAWSALPEASFVLLATAAAAAPSVAPYVDCAAPAEYISAYAGFLDRQVAYERLAVETWLLARSRKLHAAFRARLGEPAPRRHLELWDELAGRAFLATRRVAAGRPAPDNLLKDVEAALSADPDVFTRQVVRAP